MRERFRERFFILGGGILDKQLRLDAKKLYNAKEVAAYTGYNATTLRKKCGYYNIETQLTDGGHRRFSKENIEMIVAIKEKEDSGWLQDRVKEWLNGEGAPLNIEEYVPKSVDEMRQERAEAEIRELREENNQIKDAFQLVVKKMDEERALNKKEREEEREFFLQVLQKQREEDRKHYEQILETKLNEHIGNRDQKLLTSVRELQQGHKEIAAFQEQMNKKPQTFLEKLTYLFGSSK